nr:hypothetical protein [Tanacetum cinerariifolium]
FNILDDCYVSVDVVDVVLLLSSDVETESSKHLELTGSTRQPGNTVADTFEFRLVDGPKRVFRARINSGHVLRRLLLDKCLYQLRASLVAEGVEGEVVGAVDWDRLGGVVLVDWEEASLSRLGGMEMGNESTK